jgi:hypothetical protein
VEIGVEEAGPVGDVPFPAGAVVPMVMIGEVALLTGQTVT